MSLLLFDPFRPSSPFLDQPLGIPVNLFSPWDANVMRCPVLRPWLSMGDTEAQITSDKDKFQVSVDVQHFRPEEIKVTSSGNTITVEGKHEEKRDEHGFVSRHFVRRYVLPEDHDVSQVQSNLSSDGVLTIVAPKKREDGTSERTIPIQQTGQPSKPIEIKNEEKKN